MAWRILYYTTPNDRCPYLDWLASLDATVQAYIINNLDRMAEEEHLGDCPSIRQGEGLRERRLHAHGGWRIYLIPEENGIIVFWGGKKEDQNRDIRRAKRYLMDYRE